MVLKFTSLRFYRWLVILRYILRIRFPFFTLQKLTLSGWYLWLYSLTARQTLYKYAFYSLSYESLWIQLRSILLPVLYATCVMSPVFSYQNKETAGTLISQTNPQGTTLNSINYLSEPMNVAVCLSLIVHSQVTGIKMSEFEFLQDWHSRTILPLRCVTSCFWGR